MWAKSVDGDEYYYRRDQIEEEFEEFDYYKHPRPKNKPVKSVWLAPTFKTRKMIFSKSGYLPKKIRTTKKSK